VFDERGIRQEIWHSGHHFSRLDIALFKHIEDKVISLRR